jgi:hypothetical protein
MRAGLITCGFVCCGLLAGCSGFPGLESQEPAPGAPAGTPQPTSEADNLLAYFEQVRKLPAADLGKEHEAVRQAFLSARSDFSRVRLAMLLSLPGTAVSDEPRALELLDPVTKNPGAQLHRLAVLLAANLQERKRLDANAQGLQQKLDALRSLERSMIERKR